VSVTKVTTIHCDLCGRWADVDFNELVSEARKRLARIGWKTYRKDDGHLGDLCNDGLIGGTCGGFHAVH